MPTITQEKVSTPLDGPVFTIVWRSLKQGDVGDPLLLGGYADNNVEISGTFGAGGSVSIVGTLDPVGSTANILTDQNGNHLQIATGDDKLKQVLQHPYKIWPVVNGGDGTTDLTVFMKIRR